MSLSDENYNKIIDALRRADADQLLGIAKYSIELRKIEQRRVNRERILDMAVGMRVMVAGDIKPKYLQRQLGTVEDIKESRVTVKLDRGPQGKFHSGRVVAPASCFVIVQQQSTGV